MSGDTMVIGTWGEVLDGCPMKYSVNGGNRALIVFGEGRQSFELGFELEALRSLTETGANAVAEMDALNEGMRLRLANDYVH